MKLLALGFLVGLCAFAQKIEIEADQSADFTRFRSEQQESFAQQRTGQETHRRRYSAGFAGQGTHLRARGTRRPERALHARRGWGTRVIDLRDPTTRQEKSQPSKIEGKLDDMVRKSFDKYPPKMK